MGELLEGAFDLRQREPAVPVVDCEHAPSSILGFGGGFQFDVRPGCDGCACLLYAVDGGRPSRNRQSLR